MALQNEPILELKPYEATYILITHGIGVRMALDNAALVCANETSDLSHGMDLTSGGTVYYGLFIDSNQPSDVLCVACYIHLGRALNKQARVVPYEPSQQSSPRDLPEGVAVLDGSFILPRNGSSSGSLGYKYVVQREISNHTL